MSDEKQLESETERKNLSPEEETERFRKIREENDEIKANARAAQKERDTETLLRTEPVMLTAVDALGTERLVTLATDYDGPQVEPDEAEVERLKNLQTRLDNKKQETMDKLKEQSAVVEPVVDQPAVGTPTPEPPPAGKAAGSPPDPSAEPKPSTPPPSTPKPATPTTGPATAPDLKE